jgi:DNA-binding NtrC family response regulator
MAYRWPGNVRELENAVERAVILNRKGPLCFPDISSPPETVITHSQNPPGAPDDESMELDTVMRRHIRHVLAMCHGRVEGRQGAARRLGIHPSTLRKRMHKLGIPFGRSARPPSEKLIA